jgi:uncharacterized integral membrane protein
MIWYDICYDIIWYDDVIYAMVCNDMVTCYGMIWYDMIWYCAMTWYDTIYLLVAIGLTPGSSSTVHIYTQTIHRTIQLTTLVGRLSGIRTQSGQTKINDELIS